MGLNSTEELQKLKEHQYQVVISLLDFLKNRYLPTKEKRIFLVYYSFETAPVETKEEWIPDLLRDLHLHIVPKLLKEDKSRYLRILKEFERTISAEAELKAYDN